MILKIGLDRRRTRRTIIFFLCIFLSIPLSLLMVDLPVVSSERLEKEQPIMIKPATTKTSSDDSYEDNDDLNTSANISIGTTLNLAASGIDPDFFNFSVVPGFWLIVKLTYDDSETDFDFRVYDETQTVIGSATSLSSPDSISLKISVNSPATYFLEIYSNNASFGLDYNETQLFTYDLEVFLEDQHGKSFIHYNNETSNAVDVPPGMYENLSVSASNRPVDYFKFLAWNSNNVNVTVTVLNFTASSIVTGLKVSILDTSFSLVGSVTISSEGAQGARFISFTATTSGFYYLKADFTGDNGQALYQFFLDIDDSYDTITHSGDNFTASPIFNSTTGVTGLWVSKQHQDYYRIVMNEAERVTVEASFFHVLGDINLYLFNDSNQDWILIASEGTSDDEKIERFRAPHSGTYYLLINSTSNEQRYYNLSITILGPDDSFEENDDLSSAALLESVSITYDDLFLEKSESDYYYLVLTNGDAVNVTISFNGSLGNLDMYLLDQNGEKIAESVSSSGNSEQLIYVSSDNVFNLFIRVFAPSGGGISGVGIEYSLSILIFPGDDALEGSSNNDEMDRAYPLGEGVFENLIVRSTSRDWYVVYLQQGELLTVSIYFQQSIGDIDLFLYDQVGALLNSSYSPTDNESTSIVASYDGYHYIKVELFGSSTVNSYILNVTYPDENVEQFEDNDRFDDAIALSMGFYQEIPIRLADDDFYKLEIARNDQSIQVDALFDENLGDLKLELYAPNLSLLVSSIEFGSGIGQRIAPTLLSEAGTYYLRVLLENATNGYLTYDLNVTIGESSLFFDIKPITKGSVPAPSERAIKIPIGGVDLVFVGGMLLAGISLGILMLVGPTRLKRYLYGRKEKAVEHVVLEDED